VVDQEGPAPHQGVAGTDDRECSLRLLGPMADGREELRVDPPKTGKGDGINPVGLLCIGGDQLDLAGVGHDHLVAKGGE
jgi:hypothetical protein